MGIELEITPVVKDAVIDIDSSKFVNAMDDAMSQVENHMKTFISTLQSELTDLNGLEFLGEINNQANSITEKFSAMTQEWSQLFSMPMEELIEARSGIDTYLTRLENLGQTGSQSYAEAEAGWTRINQVIEMLNGSLEITPEKLKEIMFNSVVSDIADLEKEAEKVINLSKETPVPSGASIYKKGSKGTVADAQKGMEDAPVKMTKEYAQLDRQLSSLQRKMEGLVEKSNEFNQFGASTEQWDKLEWKAEQIRVKFTEVNKQMNAMRLSGDAFQGDVGADKLHEEFTKLQARAQEFYQTLEKIGKNSPSKFQKISSAIKQVISNCGRLVSSLKKLIGNFTKLGKSGSRSSTSLSKSLNKVWRNFMMFVLGFRSMYYLIKKLRTTFINELKMMAEQIPDVNVQVSNMMTALNQLKGSIATAFEPLLSVVVPILTTLIDKLVAAANAVGIFFAAMTGRGYIYKFTADQQDYAASIGDTGKAAKEAKRDLMGFDEINRLSKDTDSGGSGAGSGAGGIWEKADIEDGTSKLAELIKAGWEKADFTEVGYYLSDKLNEILIKAQTETIPKAVEMGSKIATCIATGFNGIFSNWDLAGNIGGTLALALNGIADIVDSFVRNFDWSNFATFMSTAINSLVYQIDWASIGDTFGIGLGGALVAALTILKDLDINSLFDGILTAIQNLTGSASEMLQNMGFDKIADLVLAIGDALQNLAPIIGIIVQFIKDAFDVLLPFVSALLPVLGSLITVVVNLLSSTLTPIMQTLVPILTNIVTMIMPILVDIINQITPILTEIITAIMPVINQLFIALLPIIQAVLQVISDMMPAILTIIDIALQLITTVISPILELLSPLSNFIVFLIQEISALLQPIMQIITPLLQMISSCLKPIITLVGNIINTIVAFLVPVFEIVISFVTSIVKILGALVSVIVNSVAPIITFIGEVFNSVFKGIHNIVSTITSGITSLISGMATSVRNTISGLFDTIGNLFNKVAGTIKGHINTIIGFFNRLVSGIANVINGLGDKISAFKINLPDWLSNLTGAKSFSFNFARVSAPQIPLLAKGAVIPPNKEFLAMLGDQSSGTNIEAPLSTIQDAVALVMDDNLDAIAAIGEAIIAAINNKDMSVVIGDKDIGQAAARYNRRQNIAKGV